MISYFDKKGKLQACEDSLASTVFDGLKYLPIEMFWRILKGALYQDKLPYASGEMESISFWEHWDPTSTRNKKHIEPDVFIHFHSFDIIIEAKRYNEKQQKKEQLEDQVIAYTNEFGNDKKTLYFIQLGGLHNKENEIDFSKNEKHAIICKTDWTNILEQIVLVNNQIKGVTLTTNTAYSRILEDIIKGLELHQYYKKLWLKDFKISQAIQNYSLSHLFKYAKKYK